MIFRRLRNWPSLLQAWAQANVGRPLEWGETDCGALARSALITMFGEELAPHLPQWNKASGALFILQVRGPVGAILQELGAALTSVPFMRVGDIVVHAEEGEEVGRESVMVCVDGLKCVASTRDGVVITTPDPTARVYSLWEVSFDG